DALGADEIAPVTTRHGQRHVVLRVSGVRATVSMGGGTNSARLIRGLPALYLLCETRFLPFVFFTGRGKKGRSEKIFVCPLTPKSPSDLPVLSSSCSLSECVYLE